MTGKKGPGGDNDIRVLRRKKEHLYFRGRKQSSWVVPKDSREVKRSTPWLYRIYKADLKILVFISMIIKSHQIILGRRSPNIRGLLWQLNYHLWRRLHTSDFKSSRLVPSREKNLFLSLHTWQTAQKSVLQDLSGFLFGQLWRT